MHIEWLEYGENRRPSEHTATATTETELRQVLNDVTQRRAEEVMLFHPGQEPRRRNPSLTFQINTEKTHAYLRYAQAHLGTFESDGDPESAELYTTSGGTFSPGTGIPLNDLERAALEFLRTNEKPHAITWINEDSRLENLGAENENDDEIPF